MNTAPMKMTILLVGSVFYWLFVSWLTGAKEPWDAGTYWRLWYPASLGLSALAGLMFEKRRWMAGIVVTFAQLPVIWGHNDRGDFLVIGLMMLGVLAVPAMGLSALSGWFATRYRSD